jgi:murein DD-endopeptidase MepM/ murein hydrolase activator NlpD
MKFILVSSKIDGRRTTCITHRQLAVMALAGLVLLPAALGSIAYKSYRLLAAPAEVNAELLAAQRAELAAQREALGAARTQAETHINALAQRLGQLQAHLWRLNALGAHLVQMAGLDGAEFDFGAEPAMGGPEPTLSPGAAPLLPALDALEGRLAAQQERLAALETLLMNRQLEAAVTPGGWPVNGGWISSGFGWRADPFSGRRARHEGVDIASRLGSPIHAMGDGVVRYAGPKPGYGLLVEVIHGDVVTRYAHTREVLVKVGDRVERGTPLATVGTSGRSTGPHLHFEVLRGERPLDPQSYLDRRTPVGNRSS